MTVEQIPVTKKEHGCFFYGCLTSVIAAVVVAIVVWIGIVKLKHLVNEYTSDKPADIPVVELPAQQMATLDARIQAFEQAMKEDRPARLVLTADEINAKLNSSKEFRQAGGRANVRIDGDQITAAVSIPLDMFKLKGRYLNGTATIRVGLQAGRLLVFVDQVTASGKTPPDAFMKELRSKNFAEKAMEDPDTAAAVAKLKSITVQNGVIIVER